jgi:hypothetical protein
MERVLFPGEARQGYTYAKDMIGSRPFLPLAPNAFSVASSRPEI